MNTEEINAHKRRLELLRLQAAKHGINSDPAILIEIDEIERRLAREGIEARRPIDILEKRVQAFSIIAEHLQTIYRLMAVLVRSRRITSVDYEENAVMDAYNDFVWYYNKVRLFVPSDINEQIEIYRDRFFPDDIVPFRPGPLEEIKTYTEYIIATMQSYIEQ
jgi:hypothetical protein